MKYRLDPAARDEYLGAALYYLGESPRVAARLSWIKWRPVLFESVKIRRFGGPSMEERCGAI